MSSDVRATVIVPTTGDRGPLLELSVGSVLRQSMENIEVFIVGDGVDEQTRIDAARLEQSDDRVVFIDHPKHPRRGEPYRDRLLRERAHGSFVAYLLDRDLWFRDHLVEVEAGLVNADFVATLPTLFRDDGTVSPPYKLDLATAAALPRARRIDGVAPMSTVGHTLDAYLRLPFGWRETPKGVATDSYMWHQFLDQSWIGAASLPVATVVYLKRGNHPGLSTDERRLLLEEYTELLLQPGGEDALRRRVVEGIWRQRVNLERASPKRRFEAQVRQPIRNVLGRVRLKKSDD
ncbi:MAG: glycosyltransferase family A protein [Actinomycetota bacterium]